jgi:hypothetical protein
VNDTAHLERYDETCCTQLPGIFRTPWIFCPKISVAFIHSGWKLINSQANRAEETPGSSNHTQQRCLVRPRSINETIQNKRRSISSFGPVIANKLIP